MSALRSLARSVAHVNMAKGGLKHVNRHDYTGPMYQRIIMDSYFARNWRDYITTDHRTKRRIMR